MRPLQNLTLEYWKHQVWGINIKQGKTETWAYKDYHGYGREERNQGEAKHQ